MPPHIVSNSEPSESVEVKSWIDNKTDNSSRWASTRTSIGHNVSANFVAKIVGAALNLACVPFYVRILGITGYGIVGIWATLETVANLLDLGLSAALTREMAIAAARPANPDHSRDLLRTLESIYWAIGILIGLAVILAAPALAGHWFNLGNTPKHVMRQSLVAIGVLLACRWPISLYLGGLNGLERQVFVAWVNAGFALARNVGAVLALILVSSTVLTFLVWQILVNAVYAFMLGWLLWQALPKSGARAAVRFASIRPIWRFAGGSGAIALSAFAVQDIGPLVVSKLVNLNEFGYYSLAWRLASVVYLGSIAVGTAAFPAFSRLAARGDKIQLARTYHSLCQLQSVLVLPATAILFFFGRQVLFTWTGDAALAAKVYPVSALMAAGAGIQCLGVAPFALQIANGWTSLAFYVNCAAACINIPLLLGLGSRYGIFGASVAWVIVAAVVFVVEVPLMHRRLLANEQWSFYTVDVLYPMLASAAVPALIGTFVGTASRLALMWIIPALFLASTLAAVAASPSVRPKIRKALLDGWLWAAPSEV